MVTAAGFTPSFFVIFAASFAPFWMSLVVRSSFGVRVATARFLALRVVNFSKAACAASRLCGLTGFVGFLAAGFFSIGLALHVATNAGKYGALSTDTGHVDVCWGTDGDTFTMSWTERDGPPVLEPERRGFGSVVMETMTERSIGGAVDLDYAPSGLTWRLTCPAANALEPVAPVYA
jgi:hypothetical protein